ncbi:MAG: hypothetical protein ACFFHV_21110 [Promethearchaeota archaeon]
MSELTDLEKSDRWTKVKRALKKGAKKLIPLAAGWAAGIFFPPAGAALYSFLKDKIDKSPIPIPINDDKLREICTDTIPEKSVEFLQKALREALREAKGITVEQLETVLGTFLRPLNDSLNDAMSYIKQFPEQISYLMEEWKAENQELINHLHLDLEVGFDEIKTSLSVQSNKIDNMIKTLLRFEDKLDKGFASSVKTVFSADTISDLDLRLTSRAQISMANYSSRFDIDFDPDLFEPRKEANDTFFDFLRDLSSPFSSGNYLFLVLAGAGMGKTWTSAYWIHNLSEHTIDLEGAGNFIPFLVSLKAGLKMQLRGYFNAPDKHTARINLRKAKITSGLTPILFFDGLDEIKPSEAKATLNFISELANEEIPVVLTCRNVDWVREEKIIELHSEISDICFQHSAGKTFDIKGVSCFPSLNLGTFTDDEFKNAIKRYQIPLNTFKNTQLKEMGKYPILLRLFSEYYNKNNNLPDPNNPPEFEAIFLGDEGDPPETNVLGRLGIIGPKRGYLVRLIKRFLNLGIQLSDDDLKDLINDTENFKTVRSSGLIKEEWGKVSALYFLNELFLPQLEYMAELAGFIIKKPDISKAIEPSSPKGSIADRKRYDYLVNLGKSYTKSKKYQEALSKYQQARNISEELYDVNLTIEIDELIKQMEDLIKEEQEMIEREEVRKKHEAEEKARKEAEEKAKREQEKRLKNENQNILTQAQQKFDNKKWKDAIDLYSQSKQICSQQGWSDGISYVDEMIQKAHKNLKIEIEERKKREAEEKARKEAEEKAKREQERRLKNENQNILTQAQQKFDNKKWKDAIDLYSQSKQICSQQGWSDGIAYADEMIQKANKNLKIEIEERKKREAEEKARKEAEAKAKREQERRLKNENQNILTQAQQKFDNKKWKEAIDLYRQSKQICSQQGWSDGIAYADEMIQKAHKNLKIEAIEKVAYFPSQSTIEQSGNFMAHIRDELKIIAAKASPIKIAEMEEKRKKREAEEKKINFIMFKGIQIPQFEAEVLQELETLTKKEFIKLEKIERDTKMGFSVENQNVIGIGLNDCGLSILPESITKLTSLQELWLNYNQLKTFPESISNLKSLTNLRLYRNEFRTLPESIGELSSLQILNLESNHLFALPESIGNLRSLQILLLHNNQLKKLPESIGQLSSLEKLNLYNNKLTILPESIGNLKSLTDLSLFGNQLRNLPESISQLSSLEKLNLYNNKFATLSESIGNISSLQRLDLQYNQLKNLPESIGNLISLRYLNLNGNKLTTLPNSITNLISLEELYIINNPLDPQVESVLNKLKANGVRINKTKNKQKIIKFREANIPQFETNVLEEIETLTKKEFTKFDKIEWKTKMGFSVENQRVIGIGLYECGLSTLPESIGKLSSLKGLYLEKNQLLTLPESIGKLSSLKRLYLDRNQLSTLPESIENLTSLQDLNLFGNQLSTLPESITKLKSLEFLSLSVNKLSSLPESIGQLSLLKTLDLADNQLTALPESLSKLTLLEDLELEENQLSTLPESIENLKSLIFLSLRFNKLSILQESMGQLSSLKSLWLGYNKLRTLPESLINMNSLKDLDIKNNPLKGRAKTIIKQLKKKGVNVNK